MIEEPASDPTVDIEINGFDACTDFVLSPTPTYIGRYRIERELGKGGFGLVYLAHDRILERFVAIKVPHSQLVSKAADGETYLAEARTVAQLDHPNIIPVHDLGQTAQFPCFVVSKFIDGTDLANRLKHGRFSLLESVEIVATVARALHHAHQQGLVHRDIKPGNILLDRTGKAFVGDFGLALREKDIGKGPRYAGTPSYMSPEQASGEGHRVDGRSDIFSLGVVLYELLTGKLPFQAANRKALFEKICRSEPPSPLDLEGEIPLEMERICLKAISKKASERYQSALEMAEDLHHFQQSYFPLSGAVHASSVDFKTRSTPFEKEAATRLKDSGQSTSTQEASPQSDVNSFSIIPKGLRSFDAQDSDFFLQLLPGPRTREGIPDCIRFWQTKIEETDEDKTFPIGLIFGPSGCGKSSLVKAGLLPLLCEEIWPIYIEATSDGTESRLLNGLRRRCRGLPEDLDLKTTLAALRLGHWLPVGKKVLIVIDQFEQWLHAKKEEENTELAQALRQADGSRVQCILMVRDDFWMAVIRFLKDLEVQLLEGRNSAAVDLFPIRHAVKVLAAFGRAYGALPPRWDDMENEQKLFLEQAVNGLASEGKVVSVRLALFAEMMRDKPWTRASLREVGGPKGVGAVFLEDTFSAQYAPPQNRFHQQAARSVLKSLLPEEGTEIKGHMRSREELLLASGYANSPHHFEALLTILDHDIRLITPTDPEGKEETGGAGLSITRKNNDPDLDAVPGPSDPSLYYQLTHDFLVPSLRDWLSRKQLETARGRAELLLAQRASIWNTLPENRLLPSLFQTVQIWWLTAKAKWTPGERKLMGAAARFHGLRGFLFASVLGLLFRIGYEVQGNLKATALRERLLDANTDEVPAIIKEMTWYQRWLKVPLRDSFVDAQSRSDARKQLHASLAQLPYDPGQVPYLQSRLMTAQPNEIQVLCAALFPYKSSLIPELWQILKSNEKGKENQRLRAAAALALFDPDNSQWKSEAKGVVQELVLENPANLGYWSKAFLPVQGALFDPLFAVYRDHRAENSGERSLATNLLADYSENQPQKLAELLMEGDQKQFSILFDRFKSVKKQDWDLLEKEIDKKPLPGEAEEVKESLAKRQANAGVALLRLNQPDHVWKLLKHQSDPRVRCYLIHRMAPLGVDATILVDRLKKGADLDIQRAIILGLGEFPSGSFPVEQRGQIIDQIEAIYKTEGDAGLHASAEWFLRKWGQDAWLKETNKEWQTNQARGFDRKTKEPTPYWLVNKQGQTLTAIPGPVVFTMGSPETEKYRKDSESQHLVRINRDFAIGAQMVTLSEYRRFVPGHDKAVSSKDSESLPVLSVDWYQAAKYCNWLTEQEGISQDQQCYEIKGDEVHLKANYLSLTGYRLPTEAEMEFATRAGAKTCRSYGETEDLLPQYGWYMANSGERTQPVGRLKPNDLGLFDTQGNAFTWCQDQYKDYPTVSTNAPMDDMEGDLLASSRFHRIVRGGSFGIQASKMRSAYRPAYLPSTKLDTIGFRVARTLPEVDKAPGKE